MFWQKHHISKIYEALGAIGDDRIEFVSDKNEAKIYSSSRDKFYTVTWNDDLSQMMANDNSAFWHGKLSYPMIAILMLKGKIAYDPKLTEFLAGTKWNEVNKKFKNDFDKTVQYVLDKLEAKRIDVEFVKDEIKKIDRQLDDLKIEPFGKKMKPPSGS